MKGYFHTSLACIIWIVASWATTGCQSWDTARKNFIEPLNNFLHRDYAAAYKEGDLEKLESFYHADLLARPQFKESLSQTLGKFCEK